MILKSVEIKGFKSFADFTELVFKEGITAVVGPNGSGKSNISDAIRWCLGEQSVKNLRGGKMEDVIFSGTQFRKPVSLAQVSLTIENSNKELPIEYETVKISRKLYRSGESEYSINNKVCRLKDIHELFFDTGIGKEGYSLIGQGKIEAILSGKVDDRRALIEEAIGITKYKFKKEEAQSKINNANENLIRINDILSTYSEYLKPLFVEKNKAEKFLEFSNKLKQIEIVLISNKLHKINFEISGLKNGISERKFNFNKLSNDKMSLEKGKNDLENELDVLLNEERDNRNKYYETKEKINSFENDLNLEKNNINMLINYNEIYQKQIDENKLKIQNIESRENIIIETKFKLESELKDLAFFLNDFDKNFNDQSIKITNLNLDLEKLKVHQLNIFEDNTIVKSQIDVVQSRLVNVKNEIENLKNETSIIEKKINDIEDSIEHQEFNRELKYKELVSNQNSLKSLSSQIDGNNKKLNLYKAEIEKLNKSIIIQKTNLKMLTQFEDNYDGFSRTSKNLMKEIKNGNLIKFNESCFVFGNVFHTNQEYELAIETAVGMHMSDLISDDENIAKEIIEYLKLNKLGRVTIHPLNMIKEFNINYSYALKGKTGFIDFAINLIDIDEKFFKVAKNILGKTIVCDNLDNGLNIAKFINFSNKIVTVDSQIINSGGSITGGSSVSKGLNILGRKRKIEEQKRIIDEEISKIKNVEEKFAICKNETDKLNSEFKNIESITNYLKLDLIKLDNKISSKNDYKLREVEELNKKNSSLIDFEKILNDGDLELKKLNDKFFENQNVYGEIKIQINDLSKEIETCKEQIKNDEDRVTFDKIRRAKLEENISSVLHEIERIALEKRELIETNKSIQNEFDDIVLKIKDHEANVENLKRVIEDLTIENNGVGKTFDKYVVKQNDLKNKITVLNTYIEDNSRNIYKIENDINSLEIKIVKFETEFNNLNEKLFNEYGKDFNSIGDENFYIKDSKLNDYNEKVVFLKNSISNLGNVNLRAIEEYEELNKKVEFMKQQKDDLDKSKQELEQFIEEITIKMKEIFKVNFKMINENFDKTFKELFKGGNANLLLGEGDELESSIDIVVQPPGKKLQNLNLLSGGEKGLSAISLLFAILRIKPAPFCVLDEIEAALDDNNVLKFSEFLKGFSNKIQFIVITHRKITMESSDIIYGVTMQEKGISKIVSINLANYEI